MCVRWLERGLFAAGLVCVAWHVTVSAQALTYQRQAQAQIARMVAARPAAGNAPSASGVTLVTCYPFSYVGNAPQRFVIRAERLDDAASRDRHPS